MVLTRRLAWLSQHRQFVESDGKLHGVVTLSEQFPGISPYISENGRGERCIVGQRCVDANRVKSFQLVFILQEECILCDKI